jgi:mRNA-degrading endonuclease RelE of RelBE toxin-antitoxin system
MVEPSGCAQELTKAEIRKSKLENRNSNSAPAWPKILLDVPARYERAYIMALLIPPPVFKQLAAMPKADARRLLARLGKIAAAPAEVHPNVLPLAGESGVFRVRQGNWRAVFSIEEGDLIVEKVAHRREVYR